MPAVVVVTVPRSVWTVAPTIPAAVFASVTYPATIVPGSASHESEGVSTTGKAVGIWTSSMYQ